MAVPFHPACILGNNDAIVKVRHHGLDVMRDGRFRKEIVQWYAQESLNLGGMQVHRDDVVYSCNGDHIGKH